MNHSMTSATREARFYQNGDAEAVLLKASRPAGTVLAIGIICFFSFALPYLPVSAEFLQIVQSAKYPFLAGAIGMLLAVWVGGHGAPNKTVTAGKAWGQVIVGMLLGAVAIGFSAHWLG